MKISHSKLVKSMFVTVPALTLLVAPTVLGSLGSVTAHADDSDASSSDSTSSKGIPNDTSARSITIHPKESQAGDSTTPGTGEKSDNSNPSMAGIVYSIQRVKAVDGKKINAGDPSTYTVDDSYTGDKTITSNDSGTATLDLGTGTANDGYYLITEQENSSLKTVAAPFIVKVPMTSVNTDAGSNLIYDVNVYPKNEIAAGLGIDKTVNAYGSNAEELKQETDGVSGIVGKTDDTPYIDTSQTGNNTTWNLALDANGLLADSKAFSITDDLPAGLTATSFSATIGYVDADGKVQTLDTSNDAFKSIIADINGGKGDTTSNTKMTNDTLSTGDASNDLTDASSNKSFTLTSTGSKGTIASMVSSAKDAVKAAGKDESKTVLIFNVNTKLGDSVKHDVLTNNFSYKLTASSGHEYTSSTANTDHPYLNGQASVANNLQPKSPQIGIVGASIEKLGQDTGTALSGATFAVADSEANAKAGKYIKQGTDGTLYYPNDAGYNKDGNVDYSAKSGDDGSLSFGGLRGTDVQTSDLDGKTMTDGNYNRDYYAVETKAPTGYALLSTPVKLTATTTGSSVDVKDPTQSDLPATGGKGYVWIALLVISAGAAGVYFRNKAKKNA